ncbi:MAG: hypothetical protein JWR21_1981 [Herminiimonas sp.]|nr:hypothetical protein [Herminiimonas sp.]
MKTEPADAYTDRIAPVSVASPVFELSGGAAVKDPSIPSTASLNFSAAKVFAIFAVAAGHWFVGTPLWILATFGLFVFAFSSAYFTAEIYGVSVDKKRFWHRKFERLGIRYWMILTFLSILLLAEGKSVFNWHSLVHFLGLSGVLNWLELPNHSPLGAGLWFFTLLLVFYCTYPYLARLCASRLRACIVVVVGTIGALFLETRVNVGHELWLTSLGFILGVACGIHKPKIGAKTTGMLGAILFILLVALNLVFHENRGNTILIEAISILLSLWLVSAKMPLPMAVKKIGALEPYLFEIFVIHTYIFLHLSGYSGLDFVTSTALTLFIAIGINRLIRYTPARVIARR